MLIEDDFKNNLVNKPWGHEYLIYENDNLGIWILYIDEQEKTSFHCHSKKLTGLIVLDGNVEVSFLENKSILKPFEKVMIRRGLFHSTKSISKNGSIIIEIETPKDKNDLIRLEDSYGREGLSYENKTKYRAKDSSHLWIEEGKTSELLNYKFEIIDANVNNGLPEVDDNDICILLSGGFYNKGQQELLEVLSVGDCFYYRIYKSIEQAIDGILENTKVLILRK
jgi:mannose-6-phosphate isomerase-like protein (cupin superfamily)